MRGIQIVRPDFRADINGLRAWAVVAVMLFHFGVPGFGGGYVGVDVFFVISGFLMTGIVVRGLEQGNFTLAGFYLARARRIIPALAALCALLLALGWFVLMGPDYKRLAADSTASISFLSNVRYWLEAGYFDTASHEKWLLHTWSLSVEWQFYLLLPLALWLAWRIKPGRGAQGAALGAGFALSLAACIVVTRSDPGAAFYLLPTRAWELLGGGLVFLAGRSGAPTAVRRRWLGHAGLLLIAVAVAVFDRHSSWPGWRAMLPAAAAMLVLLADTSSVLTGNRIAQWIGERSYSLYLWHWPVCVALFYVQLDQASLAVAAGIGLSLLLGHASYRLVEKPAHRLFVLAAWRSAAGMTAAIGLLAGAGLAIWFGQGVSGRFSPAIEAAAAEGANGNPRRDECHTVNGTMSPSCMYGGSERKVMLVGDSHVSALVTGVAQAAPQAAAGIVQWSYSGCVFLPGMKNTPDYLAPRQRAYACEKFNAWVGAQLAAAPAHVPVVIIGRYASAALGSNEDYPEGEVPGVYFSTIYPSATPAFLDEFADRLVQSACTLARQRTVYWMRPIPEMGVHVPKIMSRKLSFGLPGDVSISMEQYRHRNGWVWAAQDRARARCGVRLLDPLPLLCRDGRCYGNRDGRALYSDDNHLSEYGNKLLVPMFAEVFKRK